MSGHCFWPEKGCHLGGSRRVETGNKSDNRLSKSLKTKEMNNPLGVIIYLLSS